jgi:hypothetical protein
VLRWLTLLTLILLVPIVPFVLFHTAIEHWVRRLIQTPPGPATVVVLVIGLLSTDVLLPIPSSLVSTLAGGQLSTLTSTLSSWVGLNAGAVVGFLLSRTWGRPLAERLASPADLDRMQRVADRYATGALVLTRGLPILAEAMVLLMPRAGPRILGPRALRRPPQLAARGAERFGGTSVISHLGLPTTHAKSKCPRAPRSILTRSASESPTLTRSASEEPA